MNRKITNTSCYGLDYSKLNKDELNEYNTLNINNVKNMIDVAVIGLGINGASVLYNLSKLTNMKCVGFEQHSVENNICSSQGPSRIIRKAYFEGADHYIPFINRGYKLWEEIEKESNVTLFNRCGVLFMDIAENGTIVNEIVKSRIKYNFDCDRISLNDLEKNNPFFKIKDRTYQAVLEKSAGYLYANKCLKALIDISLKNKNITVKDNTTIISIKQSPDGYYVLSDDKDSNYKCKYLIVAVGSFLVNTDFYFNIFPGLKKYKRNFRIENALVNYFKFKNIKDNESLKCPFYIGREKHHLYGFPDIKDGNFLKIGIYKYYKDNNIDFYKERDKYCEDNYNKMYDLLQDYLRYFKKENVEILSFSRCTYTITSDEHYLIDRIPLEKNAFVISACSGHGFKFGPSIGEYVVKIIKDEIKLDPFFGFSRLDNINRKSKF